MMSANGVTPAREFAVQTLQLQAEGYDLEIERMQSFADEAWDQLDGFLRYIESMTTTRAQLLDAIEKLTDGRD